MEAQIALSNLDVLVYGRGPGAFTGVRIAPSWAQGIGYGLGLPVVPISDLQAVAQQALEQSKHSQVFVAMDARMGEVYYSYFQKSATGVVEAVAEEGVLDPEQLPVLDTFTGIGAGTAWQVHQQTLRSVFGKRLLAWQGFALAKAETLLKLALPRIAAGDTIQAVAAIPTYLRNPIIQKS